MKVRMRISGFADEIDQDLEKQLETVTGLGMRFISLRSAYNKGIADYTADEVKERILPLLQKYNVRVSSIGSPIGKVELTDKEGIQRQLLQLEELCRIARLLHCRYIRVFSFFLPQDTDPNQSREEVIGHLREMTAIAEKYHIVLLHENEKDIFGDIGRRCLDLLKSIDSPWLRAAFDFANFVQCGEDPVMCWEMLSEYVSYIHIKDAVTEGGVNVVCGSGEGRIKELLTRAIGTEGYRGFLTLEPHLVQFAALASLERGKADKIRANTAKDGKEGYEMQYHALTQMLEEILPEETKIRFGIIGVGSQGNAYASLMTGRPDDPKWPVPPCPAEVTIGALCDTDPAREAFCSKKYPDIPFYSDWKEMIASGEADAVITTVPHYLHPVIAIYCIEHGMHVLVEKPAGVYAKSVREMNACAAVHPEVTFGIMFNQRTSALYQKIREIVISGELGEIRRSNWIINSWWRPDSYYRQSGWRATWGGEGGGVLVNQAPHQLDLWQWICGIPSKVYAKCKIGAHRAIGVENDVTIVTEYPNGATGCFITCTHDPVGTNRLEIDLDGGKIIMEDGNRAQVLRFRYTEDEMNRSADSGDISQLTQGNASGGGMYTTEEIRDESGWGSQHAIVMQNFAKHILDGTPLFAPGSDAINEVNLQNAATLSGWLGHEVEFPVDEEEYLRQLNQHIAEEQKFPQIET